MHYTSPLKRSTILLLINNNGIKPHVRSLYIYTHRAPSKEIQFSLLSDLIRISWYLRACEDLRMEEKWKESDSRRQASLYSGNNPTSNSPLLFRSLSCKPTSSSCSNFNLPRSYSQNNPSIARKYTNIAKQHKARFYIMRRCVAMLVCWHKHRDC